MSNLKRSTRDMINNARTSAYKNTRKGSTIRTQRAARMKKFRKDGLGGALKASYIIGGKR